jgi:hypothetical protein
MTSGSFVKKSLRLPSLGRDSPFARSGAKMENKSKRARSGDAPTVRCAKTALRFYRLEALFFAEGAAKRACRPLPRAHPRLIPAPSGS